MNEKTLKFKIYATTLCVIPTILFLANTLNAPTILSVFLPLASWFLSLLLDNNSIEIINKIASESLNFKAERYANYKYDLMKFFIQHKEYLKLKFATSTYPNNLLYKKMIEILYTI